MSDSLERIMSTGVALCEMCTAVKKVPEGRLRIRLDESWFI